MRVTVTLKPIEEKRVTELIEIRIKNTIENQDSSMSYAICEIHLIATSQGAFENQKMDTSHCNYETTC